MIFVKEFYNGQRASAYEFELFLKKEKIQREEIITIQYSSQNYGHYDDGTSILLVYEREKRLNNV